MCRVLAASALLTAGIALNAVAQSPTKMPAEPVWGSIVLAESFPCCEQIPTFMQTAGSDAQVIAGLPDRAFRTSTSLHLQLDGGRSVQIVDIPGPCLPPEVCRSHKLIAWWPKHRLYVVDVSMHEARQAYLISARDGGVTKVSAPPTLSPSGQYAIAWEASPLIGNPMELIDLKADPLRVLEVASKPACPGTGRYDLIRPDPVWLDDERVAFTGKSQSNADDPNAKQVLRIVDGKPEWEC
jgi:hypothetical protein